MKTSILSRAKVRPWPCATWLFLLVLCTSLVTAQQTTTLTGTVQDDNAEPLIGVTILIKGTNTGTVTDFDGGFSLEAPQEAEVLVFSYTGYTTQEVIIGQQTSFAITLEPGATTLDEVVVVGYGTQKKRDLTGAIVSVQSEDFVKGANTSALQLLDGKASGVQVNQANSAPGGAVEIKIRGVNSINSSNEVLIVVDGLPGGSVTALSPDDIESIEVLKDASASAIYGSRAANGVVLITTKKGKQGQLEVSYNGYVGFQDVNERVDMLNGREYLTVLNDINVESGGGIIHSPEKIAAVGDGYDWQDIIFQNAITHNHQVSLQGGGNKSTYYVSLNYLDQEGVMIESGEKKYNARINYELKASDKFRMGLNLSTNRAATDVIKLGRGTNEGVGVLSAVLLFDPTIGPERNDEGYFDVNPLVAIENPMALIEGWDQANVRNTMYATTFGEYEILKGLKATVRLGAELENFRSDRYENDQFQIGRGLNGRATVRTNESSYWLVENLLSYEKTVGAHDFKILAGITFENFENRFVQTQASDFLSHVTGTNLLQSGNSETFNISSGKFINRLNSYLGRVNYAFRDKYILTASLRVDGTSRFSDKNKYAYFPSASIGWQISEEPFMANQDLFSNLKLRIGYGEIGNQGINNFETIQTFRAGSNAVLGGALQTGAIPARIPNEDLVWETTKELNVGLDFGLFDYRISGSVEYYSRNTFDQLFNQPVPFTTGFTGVRVNLGQVRNSGFDFAINTRNLTGNLTWETDLILSTVKNEVIELPEFAQRIIYGGFGFSGNYLIIQEGTPIASFYGYVQNGIFQTGDNIAESPQPNALPGHPIFNDTNGDGRITAEDKVILGDPFPDYIFGFNNRFGYKQFGLEIYLTGVQGVETFNNLVAESLYPINKERNHLAKNYLDRWTTSNPGAEFPSGVNYTSYSDGENKVNTFTVQDASFIRLKNITLTYDIPLEGSRAIKSASVYLSGENLFTITNGNFDGFDPAGNSDGPDGLDLDGNFSNASNQSATFTNYPVARTIRIGGKVNF